MPEITRWQKANVGTMLTEIKAIWKHLNPIIQQQQVLDTPNTPEKQDLDLKITGHDAVRGTQEGHK